MKMTIRRYCRNMIICSKDSYIIPTYMHLQKCLYKGLCPNLSTNLDAKQITSIVFKPM